MHKSLRIGYLNHFSELGGGEMCLLALLERLDRERFLTHLAAPDDGSLAACARKLKVPVEIIPFPRLSASPHKIVQSLCRLKNWIKSNRLDLIHANSQRTAAYMALAGWIVKKPYIFHDHELIPLAWGHHLIGRTAARVVVVSRKARERYAQTAYPVECVYSGVDMADLKDLRDTAAVRREFQIPQAAPLLVMAGRMIVDKGHGYLIRAMESILLEEAQTQLIIIGGAMFTETGEYKNKLIQMIKSLKLEDKVHFTGFRDDLMSILAAADIVVHPVINESFGRVVIEAMSLGKPVVATRTGGIVDIISSGIDGILVEPANPTGLATAIVALLRDHDKCSELGQNARKTVLEQFTVSRYTDHMSRIYQQIIAGS